ncbi:MAG: TonB C-terminal domain-containing protein [Candidatus Omnitrophota bacterium]|nr:TonB C-terminal domain-containing protein [Candidatus Omnitrophota bacterium]
MYTGSIFRICIIVSISAHLAFFAPWPFVHFQSRPKVPFQKLELTYLNRNKTPEKPAVKITAPIVPKLSALPEIKPPAANIIKPDSGQDAAKNPLVKKEESVPPKETPAKADEAMRVSVGQAEEKEAADVAIDIGHRKGAAYEKYYLDIREKIRSTVEKNTKRILRESEVSIRFIIDRGGALKKIYVFKRSGPDAAIWEEIVIQNIKKVAPFPPFTEKIKEAELPVIVTVKYEP